MVDDAAGELLTRKQHVNLIRQIATGSFSNVPIARIAKYLVYNYLGFEQSSLPLTCQIVINYDDEEDRPTSGCIPKLGLGINWRHVDIYLFFSKTESDRICELGKIKIRRRN